MAFNSTKNYYEILGVSIESSTDEIKTAYRKLARKYHPDINKSPDAIQMFKDITEAYETLSTPQEREKYNTLKGFFKQEKTTTSAKKAEESYTETKTKNENYASSVDLDKENFMPTKQEKRTQKNNSFIKTIKYWLLKLKKQKRDKENSKPRKGDNITTDVVITPEEVITGSKRIIHVLTTQTCPKCFGHRFVNGGKCSTCLGSGEISKRKKITVTIPKGIKDGAKLRLRGEGGSGKNGGAMVIYT